MKWTAELNIHLITIIHQNKGDNNAKGHLGSIILQKAETVLSVEKDREISNVTATYSRDLDIKPISFSVDDNGLPYFVDYNQNSASFDKKIKYARDVSKEVHTSILNEVFRDKKDLKSEDFQRFLIDTLAKYSINIGQTAVREWKTFYERSKMIFKENLISFVDVLLCSNFAKAADHCLLLMSNTNVTRGDWERRRKNYVQKATIN